MGKKICILGAGGYLGSSMVPYFLQKEWVVLAVDRYFFGDVYEGMKSSNLHVIKDDIRWFDGKTLEGVDVVINLAAMSNDPAGALNPLLTQHINFEGAVRLAKLAKKHQVKRYIFSSSCSVYGAGEGVLNEKSDLAPISEYAKSKIEAEKEIIKLGGKEMSVTIARLGTLYGLSPLRMRFDLIVNLMTLTAFKNNKIFITGGGDQWRPLLHVMDAVRAFYMLATASASKVNGEIFNIGSDRENYQVFQVAYTLKRVYPQVLLEKVPEDVDKRSYHVSFEKVKKVLDYDTNKSIEDGIREIYQGLETGAISDSLKTKTVQYYQYLLDSEKIMNEVKLNGLLFN